MLGSVALGAAALASMSGTNYSEELPKAAQDPKHTDVDALSAPTRVHTDWSKLDKLKAKIPMTKLCGLNVSRMTFGGGPFLGWSHCRDLHFVNNLLAAYHTKEKQFATLKMAEACGINTIMMNPRGCPVVKEYWEKKGGAIQAITYCYGNTPEELIERIEFSFKHDVSACLIQGLAADRLMKAGDTKTVTHCLDLIRKHDIPAGICAHHVTTFKACIDKGIVPDFWMKTFHHHNYWSFAKGVPENDNIFCPDPEETTAFMNDRPEPWVAFKVLAGGAIRPPDGFKWAWENGADIINVGMCDFEIVDNVNLCTGILNGQLNRKRPWCTV